MQGLVAERLGFFDKARRLYGSVAPLLPADTIDDVTPLARRRLAALPSK